MSSTEEAKEQVAGRLVDFLCIELRAWLIAHGYTPAEATRVVNQLLTDAQTRVKP